MIEIKNVTKSFGELLVLDQVNLLIQKGETLAMIGPSGCGKSTLLRLILRLEEVSSGQILIEGQEVSKLSEDELVEMRKKIGMVFQSSALFDSMNVYENVAFGLREHTAFKENEIASAVAAKLEMVGLSGKEDLMPGALSGGMQKRVGIARALAFDPQIILYDEPTTGLDPITSTAIENLINQLGRDLGATSIVVTHQLSTIFRTASRIIMMHQGKFIQCGSVQETRQSANPVVHRFITAGLNEQVKE